MAESSNTGEALAGAMPQPELVTTQTPNPGVTAGDIARSGGYIAQGVDKLGQGLQKKAQGEEQLASGLEDLSVPFAKQAGEDATRDGSILAKASQAFWMFKTFPLSMLATHGMRAAQEGAAGNIGYALNLALFKTMAGAVAIQAQQVLQGKAPLDMKGPIFWASAALKGGALGVYGDLLRDATGTQGNSLAEIAQGPLAGLLGSIGRFTSGASRDAQDEMEGNGRPHANYGAAVADFLRQWTPGSNVWYA